MADRSNTVGRPTKTGSGRVNGRMPEGSGPGGGGKGRENARMPAGGGTGGDSFRGPYATTGRREDFRPRKGGAAR